MAKNRKRYQRSLNIGVIVSVLFFGVVAASVACGFVFIKNAHVKRANVKRHLEDEIRGLQKEVETIGLRVSRAHDRQSLANRLGQMESALVPIQASEMLTGMPDIPVGLALTKGRDSDFYPAVSSTPSG